MFKNCLNVCRDKNADPAEVLHCGIEEAAWKRLRDATSEPQNPGEIQLSFSGDIERSFDPGIKGVFKRGDRILLVGELESRIKPKEGRDNREC